MTLETILAEREIIRKLVRFARAMDARDWNALDDITTADLVAELGTGTLHGRDAAIAQMRSFLDACGPTQHLIGNVLVDVDGERAASRAYVCDTHVGAGARSEETFRTLGEYHDEWSLCDGRWLMCHRTKHNHAMIGSIDVLGPGPAGWR